MASPLITFVVEDTRTMNTLLETAIRIPNRYNDIVIQQSAPKLGRRSRPVLEETTTSSATESEPVRSVIKRTKRELKEELEFIVEGEDEMSYSPQEVREMDDYDLIRNFIRITGKTELYCSHCKCAKHLTYYLHSIRTRCLKKNGLSQETVLPKTCDEQMAKNYMCNPINNRANYLLRNCRLTDAEEQEVIALRIAGLEAIGIEAKPTLYVPR
jgi:hypothetical protein